MMGLPLFAPLFDPASSVTHWSGHLWGRMTTRGMVGQYMSKPWFSAVPDDSGGRLCFHDFKPGQVVHPRPGLAIRTLSITHVDGCIGYRIEWAGRAAALVFDYEHQADKLDPDVLAHIRDADLVVYDSIYTENGMPLKLGYGHSRWQHGVKLAHFANARLCFIMRPGAVITNSTAWSAAPETRLPGPLPPAMARPSIFDVLAPIEEHDTLSRYRIA